MASCFDTHVKPYLARKGIELPAEQLIQIENAILRQEQIMKSKDPNASFLDLMDDPDSVPATGGAATKRIPRIELFYRTTLKPFIDEAIDNAVSEAMSNTAFVNLKAMIGPESAQMKYLEKYTPTKERLIEEFELKELKRETTGKTVAKLTADEKKKYAKELFDIEQKAGKNAITRRMRAFSSVFLRNNDTYGHDTLAGNTDFPVRQMFAKTLERLQHYLKEEGVEPKIYNGDLAGIIGDVDMARFQKWYTEYSNKIKLMQESGQAFIEIPKKGITDDKIANAIANVWTEISQDVYNQKRLLGDRYATLPDMRPQIVYKYYKMKGEQSPVKKFRDLVKNEEKSEGFLNADDFAEFLSARMNDSHGTEADKKSIAKTFYERFMYNNIHDWRILNQVVRDHYNTKKNALRQQQYEDIITDPKRAKEIIAATDAEIAKLPTTIEYKDDKAFMEINNRVGDTLAFSELIHGMLREAGREIGNLKTFGPNPEKTMRKFIELVKTGKEQKDGMINTNYFTDNFKGGTWYDRATARFAESFGDYMMNPWKNETAHASPMSTFLTAARNFQVVKLGAGVITNLGDFATFIAGGIGRLGTSPNNMVDGLFGYNRVTKNFTLAERQKYNAMVLDFTEVMVSSIQDRFRMMDYAGTSASGYMSDFLVRGSAQFADKVLRWTGFNWLNRSMASGAAGTAYREIGDMLGGRGGKTPIAWANLKPQQRDYFQRFDIGVTDYNVMIKNRRDLVDGNGRLNLFAFSGIIGPDAAQLNKMAPKIGNMINDITEMMVIKPSALDRGIGGFFAAPGSVYEQYARAITQFKTYSITLSRKFMVDDWSKILKGPRDEKIMAAKRLAMLYSLMMVSSVAVVQLKQLIEGKTPYDLDTAMLNAFRYTNFLPFLGDLYWDAGGQNAYALMFGDDAAKNASGFDFQTKILGPVLGDFTNLAASGLNLGMAGIQKVQGEDEDAENRFNRSVGTITKTLRGLDPIANMWQTKGIWRPTVYDNILEMLDEKAYKKQQRRLEERAEEERSKLFGGETYFITKKALTGE